MKRSTMQDEKKRQLETVLSFLKLQFSKEMLTSWSTDRIYHLIAICRRWHQQADHKTPLSCCSSSMLFDVLRCSGLIKNTCALTSWQQKGSTLWEHLGCLFSNVMLQIFTRRMCSSGVIRQLDYNHINRWIKRGFFFFLLPSCIQPAPFDI